MVRPGLCQLFRLGAARRQHRTRGRHRAGRRRRQQDLRHEHPPRAQAAGRSRRQGVLRQRKPGCRRLLGPGYFMPPPMLGIRTVSKTDRYVWTDRYLGTLVSRGVQVVTTRRVLIPTASSRRTWCTRDLDVEGGRYLHPRRHRDAEGP